MKETKEQKRSKTVPLFVRLKQLDLLGAILIIASIYCLFLALQWGGQSLPWNSSEVIGLFVGFGLLFTLFCLTQWFIGENATMPLRVLRQRSIFSGSLFLFFIGMPTYVVSFASCSAKDVRLLTNSSIDIIFPFIFNLSKGLPRQIVAFSIWP